MNEMNVARRLLLLPLLAHVVDDDDDNAIMKWNGTRDAGCCGCKWVNLTTEPWNTSLQDFKWMRISDGQ